MRRYGNAILFTQYPKPERTTWAASCGIWGDRWSLARHHWKTCELVGAAGHTYTLTCYPKPDMDEYRSLVGTCLNHAPFNGAFSLVRRPREWCFLVGLSAAVCPKRPLSLLRGEAKLRGTHVVFEPGCRGLLVGQVYLGIIVLKLRRMMQIHISAVQSLDI